MSIEAKVEEMWGDSKDDKWKEEEVRRIKEQAGIITMEEPFVGGDIDEDSEGDNKQSSIPDGEKEY